MALTRIAEGLANSCRHCLEFAPGYDKLVLASPQPCETGPIFLQKLPCERYDRDALSPWLNFMDPAIIRDDDGDDGSGQPKDHGTIAELEARYARSG